MKRYLLLFVALLSVSVVKADTWIDPETNITWRYSSSNGDVFLGGGVWESPAVPTSYAGALTIPAKIDSRPVVGLNYAAFRGCTSLVSVVIPESVTSIGDYAFCGCSSLTSAVIPDGVTAIGKFAFQGCSSLVSVVISERVTSIWDSAFCGCSSLTSIIIPEGVTIIGSSAFAVCSSLTSVVIPEGVTSIEHNAFQGCSSLTSVVIPEGVTSIGDAAFQNCSSLTSVDIPEGVTSIGVSAFQNCSSLTSVDIPEGVTSIGVSAFQNCSSLTSVVIPASVTSIGSVAFSSCSRLKEVTFLGDVPEGKSYGGDRINFVQAYAGKWNAALSAARRGTVVEALAKAGVTVMAEMTTPKTMRVTYAVESESPMVKVRAVAWKDGVRSFANIIPVRTAAEGSPEAVPNGGEVTTGAEHTFVWQVSADWATDLDKVAMEILVEEGTLLPQEKITIPALGDHTEMTITRNRIPSWRLFDALVWCYSEDDSRVVNDAGWVKIDGQTVAVRTNLATHDGNQRWYDSESGYWTEREWYVSTLLNYLYGKMGYKVLAGEELMWARAATRLELADSGLDQVSVKITGE
ncbi:MAG: leucine-rich repeat domain-containing protein [Candidatus Spyradenecus sp.]